MAVERSGWLAACLANNWTMLPRGTGLQPVAGVSGLRLWRTLQRAAAGFRPQAPTSEIRQRESQPSDHCICWDMPRRRLPRLYPPDGWLFVTWHLHAAYIENNPVQAGLAPDPAQYRWSSAWEDGELKFAAAR